MYASTASTKAIANYIVRKGWDELLQLHRSICTTAKCLDIKWRVQKNLPYNKTSFGPLTNLPDFTYLDGRPTPLGSRQKRRYIKQREYAEKIITLCAEIDFAVERHRRIQQENEEQKRKILEGKLNKKGNKLINS